MRASYAEPDNLKSGINKAGYRDLTIDYSQGFQCFDTVNLKKTQDFIGPEQ